MKLNNIQLQKHFPSSTREWNNSIYVYNKRNSDLIPLARIISIKFIKSYFDLYNYKIDNKVRKVKLKAQLRRLSCNKIHINRGEYKHTNNKTTINLFVFNRQKNNYITGLYRKFFKRKRNYLKKLIYKELKEIKNITNKIDKYIFFLKKEIIFSPAVLKNASYNFNLNTNIVRNNELNKHSFIINKLLKIQKLVQVKKFHSSLLTDLKEIKEILRRELSEIIEIVDRESLKINNKKASSSIRFKEKKNDYYGTKLNKLDKLKKITLSLNLILRDAGLTHKNFMLKTLFLIKRRNLWRIVKRKKYKIIKNLNKKNNWYITMYVNNYYKKVISKYLIKLKLYVYYKQLLYINKSKHNYVYLQYLNQYIFNIYNKNIEYNMINLKRMHLHSDILTKSIVLKLSKKRNRLVRVLKNIKKKIKVKGKIYFLNKKIRNKKLNIRRYFEFPVSTFYSNGKQILIKQLKYKKTTGFRVELKGRLSRRYTASRSVSKLTRKGNLLNLDSSYKKNSTVLLRGNLKSSLQYTKLKSKSRIGSYGIKGWISGN